jgi:hypothetical protein
MVREVGMPGTLHITNGESVEIRETGLEGNVLAWNDVLHEGPVPAALTLDELRPVRARYLATLGHSTESRIVADLEQRDRTLAAFAGRPEVVLWFEHDLFDQLQLLQILDWFSRETPGTTRITLISTDTYLGTLRPEQLAALYPARREVTASQLDLASRVWFDFRAPDPRDLVRFALAASPELPYLQGAIERHLEEFPSEENGLSRAQRQILEALDGGSSPAGRLFRACQEREERIFMGDLVFFACLRGLAQARVPLVRLLGEDQAGRQVEITARGRSVLRGESDHVRLNGIDRWLGGVHLHSDPDGQGRVWRWNRQDRRLSIEAR